MNFVLFHIGSELPSHLKYCVKQIQLTNPSIPIYLITNLNIYEPSIHIIKTETLNVPDIGSYYQNDPMGFLFRNAMLRIFYIESFMSKYNIGNVIHFDNDVLIYENIKDIESELLKLKLAITPHNEIEFVFGFSYINSNNDLKKITEELLKLVRKNEKELETIVKTMPHEMRLLGYINEQNNIIQSLPIYPTSENFKSFKYCFDPSSYGQILGGAQPGNNHYIGRKILNKEAILKFENKKPTIIINKEYYPIFNLHIHNKKLHEFIT